MSDSVQGGALASVPEVLGQQLARQEDYGISNNPESYVSYGGSKYFTDVKRGAVLQMTGEQLLPISEMGMADFFREQFIEDSETYKLGGYDPYMDEYVLANLESSGAGTSTAIDCGRRMSLQLDAGEVFTLTVDYGNELGSANNNITLTGGNVTISHTYNSSTTNLGEFTPAIFSLAAIDKNSRAASEIVYTITAGSSDVTLEWEASCLETPVLYVKRIVINDNGMVDRIAETEFYWELDGFTSPTSSDYATLLGNNSSNTVVSKYEEIVGNQGEGMIPGVGADVVMALRDNGVSDVRFDANANNRFLAWKTSADFTPDISNIGTILANATDIGVPTEVTEANGDVVHSKAFTLSETPADNFLYLIYDLRTYYQTFLSFGTDASDACCDITCAGGTGNYLVYNGYSGSISISYTNSSGTPSNLVLGSHQQTTVISQTEPTSSVTSDKITITLTSCN